MNLFQSTSCHTDICNCISFQILWSDAGRLVILIDGLAYIATARHEIAKYIVINCTFIYVLAVFFAVSVLMMKEIELQIILLTGDLSICLKLFMDK